MSEALKALGQPGSFEWRGQTYQVSAPTLKIEGLFADGCRRRVAQGLRNSRADLGEDAYRVAIQQLNDDFAACEFEYTGRVCQKALATAGGTRELAYLCLRELQPFDYSQMDTLFRDGKTGEDGLTPFARLVQLLNDLQAPHPNG